MSPLPQAAVTAEVAGFYESLAYAPAWNDRARLRQLLEALRDTVNDGLDPRDYGVAGIEQALQPGAADGARMTAGRDIRITQDFLRALLHLRRGRIDPHTLDPRWNLEHGVDDDQAILQAALQAVRERRIGQAFMQSRPQHPAYGALRNALKALHATAAQGGWPAVPGGPVLQPGVRDARVPLLRARLAASGYLPVADPGNDIFDEALEQAVRRFQSEQYLEVTGSVGPKTLAALNLPVRARIDQLRLNLERARWILPEIHDDFILVDVAGFRLHYFKGARSVWQSRVQVGRAVRRTPIFKSAITHVTINPAWHVPPGILRKDVLPKLRNNTRYLRQNRLRAYDANGRELDPDGVNWDDPKGILLRQDAWPGGALGRVAIRFPSPYMVYLHETPHTELFAKEQRAFSSGCIRVEKAYELAAMLLGWNTAKLDQMVATGKTQNANLAKPMTILLLYWTVDLHPDGRVSFKPDVYQLDPRTLSALDRASVDL